MALGSMRVKVWRYAELPWTSVGVIIPVRELHPTSEEVLEIATLAYTEEKAPDTVTVE